ncbi:metal-binding protein [Methanolobus bombayensis]|uniref:metal-binding protein n=1 Tax=Methanolobus bombayensis TaxID=38023 RepID=UPI001AE30820|nr:metal-binding protein [Methanolobus bombayensis]MBP1908468.1 putative metal-binding protein [Methanolobus bombayensis]
MPDGKTHNAINAAVLTAVLVGFYLIIKEGMDPSSIYLNNYTIVAFSAAYIFATLFLSPDLDISSKPYRRWGILKILWWPYKEIFKHRGLSHHPIFGPLSIVLNLAVIVAAFFLMAGIDFKSIPSSLLIAGVSGIVLSIEMHIIADNVVSKMKVFF